MTTFGTGPLCEEDPDEPDRCAYHRTYHAATDADELECLESGDDDSPCAGPVEYRMALSATGTSFPRCNRHWMKRLAEQERIDRDYPDSPFPPAWFDPADAGEHWDSDY